MIRYDCCDDERREQVRVEPGDPFEFNGIDFVEVRSDITVLDLWLLNALPAGEDPIPLNLRVEGGVRVLDIEVVSVVVDAADRRRLVVTVDRPGDFSPYTLSLVPAPGRPLDWLDPRLSSVEFSFRVECPPVKDCRAAPATRSSTHAMPRIDYLARDFTSFRRLMLDRMAELVPEWAERNPADMGVALVELLAYVGDHLSYRQDAIAEEAYLTSSRRRISARRHARLVDYFMHDGANARTFVCFGAESEVRLPRGTTLYTRVEGEPARLGSGTRELKRVREASPIVFETMEDAVLHPGYERIELYTWGDRSCRLPAGSTCATLAGHYPGLEVGDVLVFEEIVGPRTGAAADADPEHRHAVRLTKVPRDPETCAFVEETDPVTGEDITTVQWAVEDALPFAVCLSTYSDPEFGRQYLSPVSIARANVVAADHGETIVEAGPLVSEYLGPVPSPDPRLAPPAVFDSCRDTVRETQPVRFRPALSAGPLTQVGTVPRTAVVAGARRRLPFDPGRPAADVFSWNMRDVVPAIELVDDRGDHWTARRDLLRSGPAARDFVVEVDDDGRPHLRFGDDENGLRPADGTVFAVTHRIGNGKNGNVGSGAIGHIVSDDSGVIGVVNPLPARGGADPQPLQQVVEQAPVAWRELERAVTPEDYATLAERHAQVQKATATLRWTGSWHTIFVTVDRIGGLEIDGDFTAEMRGHLERYRTAGHDLEIDGPVFVPLEIEVFVCAAPGQFRSDVEHALRAELGSGTNADGAPALFHPDRFTFGQPLYLSEIYGAAHAVAGVDTVRVDVFRRNGTTDTAALAAGVQTVGRLEIIRLDDDPNFPENGVLRLVVEGGR